MARTKRLESRVSLRVVAGLLSAMLHLGLLLLILLAGGRQDGVNDADTPFLQLVMLESHTAEHRDGIELPPRAAATPAIAHREPLHPRTIPAPLRSLPEIDIQPDDVESLPPVASIALDDTAMISTIDPVTAFVMPEAQSTALLQHIERLAEELAETPRTQMTWTEAGTQYDAELILERASNGLELDRVVAEISAEDRGRRLQTRVLLKRLPFSHYTQLIDHWDRNVQIHDDEIVGRVHINNHFNVLSDSQARPALLGKVSTAAGSFNMQSIGSAPESEVFRQGIETRAARISLSDQVHPFVWAPRDGSARIHEFADDAYIRFFANGSYWWRDRKSGASQFRDDPTGQPVYFIAARGVTLFVQGVVAGKILVYSPRKIVVEGSLTYARDPRASPDSGDYLGLVCDGDIVVAPPHVTGPGDVHIHAALYAKRRFVVTDIEHSRSATLRIYGSLAAGSLTASEPRYATKLEFDGRFEQLRPPGFPSTNRFVAEDWDRRWTEVPEQSASDAF